MSLDLLTHFWFCWIDIRQEENRIIWQAPSGITIESNIPDVDCSRKFWLAQDIANREVLQRENDLLLRQCALPASRAKQSIEYFYTVKRELLALPLPIYDEILYHFAIRHLFFWPKKSNNGGPAIIQVWRKLEYRPS